MRNVPHYHRVDGPLLRHMVLRSLRHFVHQSEGLPIPREMETKQLIVEIPYPHPRYSSVFIPPVHHWLLLSITFYRESPLSPFVLSHGSSCNRWISPSITPSHSAPTSSASALIQRQESHRNQPVDLPSPTSEAASEDEAESDITQMVQRASQRSWILASRIPRAPKKTMDAQFMAYMVDRWRQTNNSDASSTSSTAGVSWIGLRGSITSSAFSPSFAIASTPPGVEFPPTPIFKDEFPEEIMRKVKSSPLYSSTSRGFVDRNWSMSCQLIFCMSATFRVEWHFGERDESVFNVRKTLIMKSLTNIIFPYRTDFDFQFVRAWMLRSSRPLWISGTCVMLSIICSDTRLWAEEGEAERAVETRIRWGA